MDAIEFVRWCDEKQAQLVLVGRRDFYDRIERDRIDRYERLGFHLVIHCTNGTGVHRVDFEDIELSPDTALYIQPGQVHQLSTGAEAAYEAHYVAFPTAPNAPRPTPVGPNLVQLDLPRRQRLDKLYDLATSRPPHRAQDIVAAEDAGLRDLLYLGFGFATPEGSSSAGTAQHPRWATEAFAALRGDLETHLQAGQTVRDRFARLGFSTRTLDRACHTIAGTTAKRVCDNRLALEARRLLSLPAASSSMISAKRSAVRSS